MRRKRNNFEFQPTTGQFHGYGVADLDVSAGSSLSVVDFNPSGVARFLSQRSTQDYPAPFQEQVQSQNLVFHSFCYRGAGVDVAFPNFNKAGFAKLGQVLAYLRHGTLVE